MAHNRVIVDNARATPIIFFFPPNINPENRKARRYSRFEDRIELSILDLQSSNFNPLRYLRFFVVDIHSFLFVIFVSSWLIFILSWRRSLRRERLLLFIRSSFRRRRLYRCTIAGPRTLNKKREANKYE